MFEIDCCKAEGDGDRLLPVFRLNSSPVACGLGRQNMSERVGEEAEDGKEDDLISLSVSVGDTTGLGARLVVEVLSNSVVLFCNDMGGLFPGRIVKVTLEFLVPEMVVKPSVPPQYHIST